LRGWVDIWNSLVTEPKSLQHENGGAGAPPDSPKFEYLQF